MALDAAVSAVSQKLQRFLGIVSIGAAQRLIRDSAWWHGHPHGPARAPKHYDRVVYGAHGWEIDFGANFFLVEKAIRRCAAVIEEACAEVLRTGNTVDASTYRYKMSLAVRGAVANFQGNEYESYYDTTDGFMLFGTQAIRVDDFVNSMCELSDFRLIAD